MFICPFESGQCRKEGKKLPKFEYLGNEKSFLDEIKSIFHSFEGLSFGEKTKIVETRFKNLPEILAISWTQDLVASYRILQDLDKNLYQGIHQHHSI